VQNGRVKMQRVFLTGYSIAAELDEVRLTLDYFTTQENVDLEKMTAVVCGKLANDPLIMGDVESALDLPVVVWNCPGGPEWTLNVGAAKSRKDFGIPNLAKQMKGPSPVKTRWQAYVLLASVAMLAGTVITTSFSNLNWEFDLNSLDETLRILKIQEAQNNGNAERYYEYESKYDAYSSDWDTMFANLRTYNDNLAKMLEEIEQTIPKDAAVVTIGIANEGLGLQFACEDKEMAAYLIMSLRDLKYAELKDISNLSVGPGTTAQDMLPSLSRANQMAALGSGQSGLNGVLNGALNGAVNGAINGAAGALNGSEATPPTGAADLSALLGMAGSSGIDLSKLTPEQQKQLMEMYMSGQLDSIIDGSGAIQVDPIIFMGQAIKSGDVTEEDMFAGMERLTGEQLDALDIAYSTTPDPKRPYTTIKYMRSHEPGIEARADAIEKMLTTDDFAVYRFHNAFLKDLSRKDDDSILFVHIKDDLRKSGSLFGDIISEDVQKMKESMPDLIEILTRDEQTIEQTEDLFNTDTRLANKYLYYWAVEAGVRKADKDAGSIKMDVLMNDIVENDLANNTDELEEAVDALIMAVINNDPDLYKQWEKDTGGSLDDEEEVIEDTRIHFAVALGYKEELIEAEQYHKGLPYYAKLNKVEVK
ncbi:MAG: hypothetical protein IJ486_10560, partial [Firmicutes bacterium]|nr:hypothetical protein [Bacillota bacterium]